jgi:hypothetical protein
MIAGNVADSECWHIPQEDGSTQRLYASFTKGYVVWLEPRDNGGWTFSTAYNVEREKIRVYVKIRGTKKIWCRVKS